MDATLLFFLGGTGENETAAGAYHSNIEICPSAVTPGQIVRIQKALNSVN